MKYKKKFDFEHITLLPNLSYVDTRSECDTTIRFGKHKFKLPVVPANMESVINEEMAIEFAKKGYFYVLHRFGIDQIEFIRETKKLGLISSISIGVNVDSYELINTLSDIDMVPDYITIDVAHGHSLKMKKMIKHVKSKLPNTFLIGGNVCTPSGVIDLEDWGCDSIQQKLGVLLQQVLQWVIVLEDSFQFHIMQPVYLIKELFIIHGCGILLNTPHNGQLRGQTLLQLLALILLLLLVVILLLEQFSLFMEFIDGRTKFTR